MKHLRFIFIFFIIIVSCKKEEPVKLYGEVFGTTYTIIYYDYSDNLNQEIQRLFDKINQSLSTYIPTSDISKINRGDTSVKIDKYFKEVFEKSERIYKETDGHFDPTIGVLSNAWGFGPQKRLNNLTKNQVDSLLQFVGFDKVKMIENKIAKESPEIYFDFNAIAKGYGIDVVARFLENKKVENYLVEIGGEIRCKGSKPDGSLWTVQIDNPNTDGTRSAFDVLQITNKSMASSGNYRKFRIGEDGEKYVHTINPKTGLAKESNLLAATVIANMDCANVDAYATAFMTMGLAKSKEFLKEKPELKVIFIYADEKGELKEFRN